MSELYRDLTLAEVGAAQAILRNDLVDIDAMASLMGTTSQVAGLTVETLRDSTFLERAVLRALLSRLKRVPAQSIGWPDVDLAFVVYGVFREAGTPMHPAPDLTLDELAAVGAAMRDERVADHMLEAFLSDSPSAVRGMLAVACHSSVLDDILTICLFLRIHGLRVAPREINSALSAVLEHQTTELRRAAAH